MDQELQDLAKHITPSRFELLAEQHQLDTQQRARAKAVLVDKEPVSVVAARANVTEEAIRKLLRQLVGSIHETVRLTESHFELAIQQVRRMTPRNIDLVRRVLVDGESVKDVAESAGLSRSTLNKAVNRVKGVAVPEGWRVVTVTLPDESADEVERMEEEAYRVHLKKQEQ